MMGSWVLANGDLCIPEDPRDADAVLSVYGRSCRWTGSTCSLLDGGEGRVQRCTASDRDRLLAQGRVTPLSEIGGGAAPPEEEAVAGARPAPSGEPSVPRVDPFVIGAGEDYGPLSAEDEAWFASLDNTISGAINEVKQTFGLPTAPTQVATGKQPTTAPRVPAPAAPTPGSPEVQQASMMPGGPWPWLIGGGILLAVGGTALVRWYRRREEM